MKPGCWKGRGHGNGHILSGHWDNPLEIMNVWCDHFSTYKKYLFIKTISVLILKVKYLLYIYQ